MLDTDLVRIFAAHRTLKSVPREQLEWLAARSTVQRFEVGEQVSSSTEPLRSLFIILSGHTAIRVDKGGISRKVMEWHGGDVSGILPYSRLVNPPGWVTVEEPTEIAMMDMKHFPEMISRCHELTATLVHVMLDRTRRFTKSDLHDEKMLSLGRLAAALAHELNNPASAVARSAKELRGSLDELEATALALGAERLTAEQLSAIARVRSRCELAGARMALTPLERADRQEAVEEWLSGRGMRAEVAAALTETPLAVEELETLAASLDADALGYALHAVGAGHRVRTLASELESAADRIHKLVGAVKGFTRMDQASAPEAVAIGEGLTSTLMVLGGKARAKSIHLSLSVAEGLPTVQGFAGELNQVWQNLIDNAIDAAPESGHVEVSAGCQGDRVVVRVVDDGPGVPAHLKERLFEPFFTTKPVGHGTGLGLDIARRLVSQHEGDIEFESRPGRTEFRALLPRSDRPSRA